MNRLFQTIERVRALAKSGRAGHDADFMVLADELSPVPLDDALPIARAFTHFLHLANIAEQHHRIRRRRAYQRAPLARAQRGSCEDAQSLWDALPRFVRGVDRALRMTFRSRCVC